MVKNANPLTSIYWIAYETGFSQTIIFSMLHAKWLYPLHEFLVQGQQNFLPALLASST